MPAKKKRELSLNGVKKIAKQYSTRTEWRIKHESSYLLAGINGWRDECCKHMKNGRNKWNLDNLRERASKYKTRGEWAQKDQTSYHAAHKMGVLDKVTKHMGPPRTSRKLSPERIAHIASHCTSRTQLREVNQAVWRAASDLGILDDVCKHMGPAKSGPRPTKKRGKQNGSSQSTGVHSRN